MGEVGIESFMPYVIEVRALGPGKNCLYTGFNHACYFLSGEPEDDGETRNSSADSQEERSYVQNRALEAEGDV